MPSPDFIETMSVARATPHLADPSTHQESDWVTKQTGAPNTFPSFIHTDGRLYYKYIELETPPPGGWDYRIKLLKHNGGEIIEPYQSVIAQAQSGVPLFSTRYGFENYWNIAQVDFLAADSSSNLIVVGHFGTDVQIGDQVIHTAIDGGGIFIAKYGPAPTRQLLWSSTVATPVPYCVGPIFLPGGVAVDADRVYICGIWQGTCNFGTGNQVDTHSSEAQPATDSFVAAYSLSTGQFQWFRRLAILSQDKALSLCVAGGKLIVVGYFQGTCDFGNGYNLTSNASRDMYIWRLNPATGDTVWAANYGGDFDDRATGVCRASDNEVFVTGFMWSSSMNFGNGIVKTRLGGGDLFLAKYNVSGGSGPSAVWVNTYGGTGPGAANTYLEPKSIAANAAGEVAITGGMLRGPAQVGSFTINSAYSGSGTATAGILTIKFSAAGTPLWARCDGGGSPGGTDTGNGVAIDSQGNVYLAASLFDIADFGLGFAGLNPTPRTQDPLVVKFNNSGTALWNRRFLSAAGQTNGDFGICVLPMEAAGIVFFGGGFTDNITFGGQAAPQNAVPGAIPTGFLLELSI